MKPPMCNTETGEIINCKKGSKEYKHEKKHINFSKTKQGMVFEYLSQLSEFYTIICIILAFFIPFCKYLAAVGGISMLFFFIYEEIWCNK